MCYDSTFFSRVILDVRRREIEYISRRYRHTQTHYATDDIYFEKTRKVYLRCVNVWLFVSRKKRKKNCAKKEVCPIYVRFLRLSIFSFDILSSSRKRFLSGTLCLLNCSLRYPAIGAISTIGIIYRRKIHEPILSSKTLYIVICM